MAIQIQLRRGTAALWTSTNPTLAQGEIGLEYDTGLFKIGDGATAWTSLGYGGPGGVTGGDSHDHVGGDGAQIDHGGLAGLADDDHTQYLKTASLLTAIQAVDGTGSGLDADLLDGSHASDFAPASDWVTPTFSAGNFTASGSMTWTVEAGDVIVYRYKMISADTMVLQWFINTTTVGGTPSTGLRIAIPNSKVSSDSHSTTCRNFDSGTGVIGFVEVANGESYITIFRDAAVSNWTASTNNTYVRGQLILKVS